MRLIVTGMQDPPSPELFITTLRIELAALAVAHLDLSLSIVTTLARVYTGKQPDGLSFALIHTHVSGFSAWRLTSISIVIQRASPADWFAPALAYFAVAGDFVEDLLC